VPDLSNRQADLHIPKEAPEPKILAAVDLGSNSFHMVVARLSHGQPKVIDRLREMVRLAAGLDSRNQLDEDYRRVALDCLSRFGERIRAIHADSVRVVGTNTFRKLGRSSDFVKAAAQCLGHPVEIISGIEEARLIYQGVMHTSPAVEGIQLVIDIGGGSTEIIRGRGFESDAMESLEVGCVDLSTACFGNGKLSKRRFERARLTARLELQPIRFRFRENTPIRVIGASGTIRTAQAVLSALAGETTPITFDGLQKLIKRMISAGHLDRVDLPGLSEQRKPVFPGGVAILLEVMAALKIDQVQVSDGALREGLLYDMVGRLTNEDARVRTVRSMEGRFNIDTEQADRVESAALVFLEQVGKSWKIERKLDRQLLRWAARLHEIGLHIAHSHYHHHGAYLLEHADMPGFPTDEQQLLARLVGAHRNRIDKKYLSDISGDWHNRAKRLIVLLRLAALFNRSRTDVDLSEIVCRAKGQKLSLEVSQTWLVGNPLTWADLVREEKFLSVAGIEMILNVSAAEVVP